MTVRQGGRIERERFSSLEDALDAIESRGRELQGTTREKPVDTKVLGRWEPAQQVAARLELARLGGIDVRGDGSAVAFTGRLRRRPVPERDVESPYDALRRVLAPPAG
ncbi:MAG: hypothetical protein QOI19_586 [Thermoleophilaceae bacterium]|nr:hypothetical protein [Thermoleophilaceae bacterium]